MHQNLPQNPILLESGPLVQAMDGPGVNNIIALTAAVFALVSVTVAVWVYIRTERRERRIEKSSAYLNLEIHSSEAFRYQAENAPTMLPLRSPAKPDPLPQQDDIAWEMTLNYYFQCLNLFEVCANFRRHSIISKEVFASWVAWFHDILKDWYFRSVWRTELRSNYTRDIRNIFDVGLQIFERSPDPVFREREFYRAVAFMMGGCHVVEHWLDDMSNTPVWPPDNSQGSIFRRRRLQYAAGAMTGPVPPEPQKRVHLDFRWNGKDDAAPAAAFAARVIGQSVDYISHGEIQAGLSPDGRRWAPDLHSLYASDFSSLSDRDLIVARTGNGAIAAFAILAWERTPRRSFAVIEDMAVDPDLRSAGAGAQIIEALTERVRDRGIDWVFLESGVANVRAHAFFKRHGFAEVSHVFARRLDKGMEPISTGEVRSGTNDA